ncbi:MAG: ABC transporter permease [Pseudomonadota bacterium]
MTSLRIAWRMVQARGLHHLVTVFVVALGFGLMLATVAVGDAARRAVSTTAERFPLVVGPKIGAVPLVLGALTGLQDLDAAVDEQVYLGLRDDPRVEVAVPLLAGHAVAGHALLGTSPARLLPRERYPLQDGRVFETAADEVVLGAAAALSLALEVGDEITIEHHHAGAPERPGTLKVVGVLRPTNTDTDDTLFCPLEAIYRSHQHHHHAEGEEAGEHEHEDEPQAEHEPEAEHGPEAEHEHHHEHHHEHARLISALLLRPVSEDALLSLEEDLQARGDLEVALSGQTLRRLADRLAGGGQLIRLLAGGVVLVTFLSLLLSVYGNALAQGRELAVLRVLGARRARVLGIVASSTLAVVLAGALAGVGLAGALAGTAERVLRANLGLEATVTLWAGSAPGYLAAGLVVLVLVGLQPALAAYHVQAAEALSEAPGSGRATRSHLRWSMRFLIPLAIFIWAEQAMSRHESEGASRPLDEASEAIFSALTSWSGGPPPAALTALDGQPLTLQGYMYALGDPWTVQDFYLVALDPRLPRCPFCYRAPTRHERVLVRTRGREEEVAPGLVEVRGVVSLRPEERDQVVLDLDTLTVVVER